MAHIGSPDTVLYALHTLSALSRYAELTLTQFTISQCSRPDRSHHSWDNQPKYFSPQRLGFLAHSPTVSWNSLNLTLIITPRHQLIDFETTSWLPTRLLSPRLHLFVHQFQLIFWRHESFDFHKFPHLHGSSQIPSPPSRLPNQWMLPTFARDRHTLCSITGAPIWSVRENFNIFFFGVSSVLHQGSVSER